METEAITSIPISLNNKDVLFAPAAIDRLRRELTRMNKGVTPQKPEKTARRLFKKAKEEVLSPTVRIRRLLNNGSIEARYFIKDKWRFVLVDKTDHWMVITIEPNVFIKKRRLKVR